jgi:serine/threonine protein kinase/tetratricopeptide (TPR) repeat protein
MSDMHANDNGRLADGEESLTPPVDPETICPTCGAAWEIPTGNLFAELTVADGEMPPPPSPLPEAVAQIAAGLLVAPERAGPAALPVVAGYEILGPLGRGGMGLVYQARKLESGQVVALKMIRGGAQAELRDLARFRTEAEAVTRLQHPNIVPIYEVGEQDGWAYFALEFVPGGSLARQLAGRPQPAGEAARLVETLAWTMDYAHTQGIVHRDLKPANILLQKDKGGRMKDEQRQDPSSDSCFILHPSSFVPKISDFGLAKRLDSELATSAPRDRTQTGEILGTPSYMAPEQTWGQPGEVGPRTDVYALGAILYECLTGRAPFQATTPLDILFQVRNEEPVPPRRLVPSVPRDLDTICLQCLQKEPRRRYPSAAALARDLQRFLAGRPIEARPEAAWHWAVRWARRRKAAAALAGVSLAAVLSLVTFGAWHYAQLQEHNAELRAERNVADRLRELAQAKEAETRKQKDAAEEERQRAEKNFQGALAAVDRLLGHISAEEGPLAGVPRAELLRRALLTEALGFYQGFLKEKGTDPGLRRETAVIYFRVGDLQGQLGERAAAEKAYAAGIALFQELVAQFPERAAYRYDLAGGHINLGNLLVHTPRQKEAAKALRRALDIQQALVEEFPLSADYRSALAGSQHNLGTSMLEARQLKEAEKVLRQALFHRRQLAEEHPEDAAYRQDLARTLSNLGHVLDIRGRPEEAEREYRRAIDLQQELQKEFPRVPSYRRELAGSHNGLANALAYTKRLKEAETEFGRALDLQQRLAANFPRIPAYRQELARSHHNLALLLERTKRPEEAQRNYRQALDLHQGLVREFPKVPVYQSELGNDLAHLARVLRDGGRLADARREAERAVEHQRTALTLLPGHPGITYSLANNAAILAETLVRLGDHGAAVQAAAELPRCFPTQESAHRQAASYLARCMPLAQEDRTLPVEKRETLAKAYGDQAMALLRQGLVCGPRPGAGPLNKDPGLASLRPRADFQKLVREWEEASRSGAK